LGQVASAPSGLAQTVPGGYIPRLLATLLLLSSFSAAQESNLAAAAAKSQPVSDLPVWSTTLTQPNRYISAHGIRGFAGGYSEDGLEFWSFPLQSDKQAKDGNMQDEVVPWKNFVSTTT